MTFNELYKKSFDDNKTKKQDVDYLVKYYLGLDLSINLDNVIIDEAKANDYFAKLNQINSGKPIQYVVGNVDFYGYNFITREGTLIPRFETEELVDYTKKEIIKHFSGKASILDVGTGSGVIGITLKKELYDCNITMVDISDEALTLAKENAKELDADVKIYKSDMLTEVINKYESFDVIISNPPYIAENEPIMDIVKENEPHIALYGGTDGLKYYRSILSNARKIMKERCLIAFEIGANQAIDIVSIAREYFGNCKIKIKDDMEGHNRMFFLFYNLND